MSNFICPTCGMNNIDCGKAGYKTDREIELEKKLEIAVKALEIYADENNWIEDLGYGYNNKFPEGSDVAQKALAKIKEIK